MCPAGYLNDGTWQPLLFIQVIIACKSISLEDSIAFGLEMVFRMITRSVLAKLEGDSGRPRPHF